MVVETPEGQAYRAALVATGIVLLVSGLLGAARPTWGRGERPGGAGWRLLAGHGHARAIARALAAERRP